MTFNCSKCLNEKAPEHFNKNRMSRTGYKAYCRQCQNEHSRGTDVERRERKVTQLNKKLDILWM